MSLSVNMQNVIKEAQNSATSSSSSSSSSDTAEAGKRFNIDLPTISETTASSCVLSDLSPDRSILALWIGLAVLSVICTVISSSAI